MNRILVVATGRKTRGGITSVVKAHEQGEQWKQYHCHWIQTHRDDRYAKYLYLLWSLIEYLALLPFYDIVHIHCSLHSSCRRKRIFFDLARLLHKKTIVHFHAPGEQYLDAPEYQAQLQHLFFHADRVLVLSPLWKRILHEKLGISENVQVLFNPCPIVIPGEVKKNVILFAGTLNERKGYDVLLKAFGKIASRFPEWKLCFAGNGEISSARKLATELDISNQVEFLGWVDGESKELVFQQASIFCLPSYGEGFPMAVLDAWAYGLPVITTPVGGIPDVAVDGENILLCSPGDENSLARQMERLMTDVQLRAHLHDAALHFARHEFGLDSINQQLGNVYKLLENHYTR